MTETVTGPALGLLSVIGAAFLVHVVGHRIAVAWRKANRVIENAPRPLPSNVRRIDSVKRVS